MIQQLTGIIIIVIITIYLLITLKCYKKHFDITD